MARRILAGLPLRWWNWQTHRTQNAAPKGMRVQVPPGVQRTPTNGRGFSALRLKTCCGCMTILTDRAGLQAAERLKRAARRDALMSFLWGPVVRLFGLAWFSYQKIPSCTE